MIQASDAAPLAPGEYRVEVRPNGGTIREIACAIDGSNTSSCVFGILELSLERGGKRLRLVMNDAPATVVIAVWRGQILLGEQTFAPKYFQVTPNGPMEDPICLQAEVEMTVSAI